MGEHANKHNSGYLLEGGVGTGIRRGNKRVFSFFCNTLKVYIYPGVSYVIKIKINNFPE